MSNNKRMKHVIEAVKDTLPKTKSGKSIRNYSLSKRLKALGCDITPQGLDQYEDGTKSVKIDVLIALQKLSGIPLVQFWKILEKDSSQL